MNSSELGCLMREIAEIALEASSGQEFRQCALERMSRTVGFDAAGLTHARSALHLETETWGVTPGRLQHGLPTYLGEIEESEWKRTIAPRTVADVEVLPRARMESMLCFKEFLVPEGLFGFRCRSFLSRHGISWMTFSRSGRHRPEFAPDSVRALDAVTSTLAIGDAIQAKRPDDRATVDRRAWTREHGVTDAEHLVLDLLERGLTTAEIAQVLGRSPNTARNQVASLFKKLRVSTRTELAFVFANPTSSMRRPPHGLPHIENLVASAQRETDN